MVAFGKALRGIRRRVWRDIRQPGLGRAKVVASVVRLLELTAARIGNEEYATANHSYGLTTLRDRHVQVGKTKLRLRYRGKTGREHSVDFDHPRLARIVKQCRDLPGMHLFQYVDEQGVAHNVTSGDVNDYLAEAGGGDFSAKDFRTWTGTVLAALALGQCGRASSISKTRRNISQAIEQVAERLGNTPAICKKCYVHPAILEAYSDGTLAAAVRRRFLPTPPKKPEELRPEERAILVLLKNRMNISEEVRLGEMLRKSVRAMRTKRRAAEAKPAA
jgi:DNA topoisomerase-1